MMACDVYGCIFFGVQSKSKHLRENEKKLSFRNNFRKKRLKPLWPETCHYNILSATYFSVQHVEKCCQLFLLQQKIGLCFLLNRSN